MCSVIFLLIKIGGEDFKYSDIHNAIINKSVMKPKYLTPAMIGDQKINATIPNAEK